MPKILKQLHVLKIKKRVTFLPDIHFYYMCLHEQLLVHTSYNYKMRSLDI